MLVCSAQGDFNIFVEKKPFLKKQGTFKIHTYVQIYKNISHRLTCNFGKITWVQSRPGTLRGTGLWGRSPE